VQTPPKQLPEQHSPAVEQAAPAFVQVPPDFEHPMRVRRRSAAMPTILVME
jgi:hypothetical protein